MKEQWTDEIPEAYIALLCDEYAKLFRRVKKHTGTEFHASLVAQELLRRFPPMLKENKKFGPAYKVQIDELEGYGIHKLSDLNWRQAFDLIESERTKRQDNPY